MRVHERFSSFEFECRSEITIIRINVCKKLLLNMVSAHALDTMHIFLCYVNFSFYIWKSHTEYQKESKVSFFLITSKIFFRKKDQHIVEIIFLSHKPSENNFPIFIITKKKFTKNWWIKKKYTRNLKGKNIMW